MVRRIVSLATVETSDLEASQESKSDSLKRFRALEVPAGRQGQIRPRRKKRPWHPTPVFAETVGERECPTSGRWYGLSLHLKRGRACRH